MNKEYSEVLREYVADQQHRNPAVSSAQLAKKMGIPPTTFNRLVNGYSQPNFVTLVKLLQNIPELKDCMPKEIQGYINQLVKKERDKGLPVGIAQQNGYVNGNGAVEEKEGPHYFPESKEALFNDKHVFLCWVLCFAEEGITQEEIQFHFGQKGVQALSVLVKANIVHKRDDSSYRVVNPNKDTIMSSSILQKHITFLIDQCDETSTSNYVQYWVEHLNDEGIKHIISAQKEFRKKTMSVMLNKKYRGDRACFALAGCGPVVKPIKEGRG